MLPDWREGMNEMERHKLSWCTLVVACLLVSRSQDSLTVRIELDGANNRRTLNFEEPFRTILINNSNQTIRIWNPETEKGYYQFSFQFKNLRSGKVSVVHKRRIDDKKFWSSLKHGIEPDSESIEIAPKTSFATEITLSDSAWGDREWEGLPCPNSNDRFEVSAQFEVTIPADTARNSAWNGKVESTPITASLIAPRLKTPHDYLQNGFSDAAIEMMRVDPKWISARDHSSCTPLHQAAWSGQIETVKWLLDHGADVNALAVNDFTPLHAADDERVIALILQKNPDLSIRARGHAQTPLQAPQPISLIHDDSTWMTNKNGVVS